jgi:hypothetical protein
LFQFIKYTFVSLVAVVTSLTALEYQLENCGTLSYVGYHFDVKSINNQGVIAGDFTYVEQGHARSHGIFQYDRNDGLRRLTMKQTHLAKINDNGLIIGNTTHSKAFMIESMCSESLKILDFDHIKYSRAYDLNNLGQIVGYYATHDVANYPSNIGGFIWDASEFKDFGPKSAFAHEFIPLGYTVLGNEIHAINEKGHIAGVIYCGKFNPYTNKMVFTEKKIFFYDSVPHILPYHITNLEWLEGDIMLTDSDEVIYYTWYNKITPERSSRYRTYSWHKNRGIRILGDFQLIKSTSHGDLIGRYEDSEVCSIFINNKLYNSYEFLGIDENADPFSDTFEFSKVKLVDLNDSREITGNGQIWEGSHPFIAIPKKLKSSSLNK